jgi:hypothetical protein
MCVRDPTVLRQSARRLHAMVRVFNVWFVLFLAFAFLILLATPLPDWVWRPALPLLKALGIAVGALALLAWPAWFAIRLGVVKCPCCGSRFANRVFSFVLERNCDNCGFDVSRVSRQGDF